MTLEHLILMRHGETAWNREQRLQGQRDIPLSDVGRMQATDAAPSVAALRPEVIVASDLQRTQHTAAAVAGLVGVPVGSDPRLRETAMGLWEGLSRDEVVAGWPQEWDDWRTTSAHAAPPGGESRWQVAQRAAGVVAELDAGTATRALLVSHGGTVVGLTGHLMELPEDCWGLLVGVMNCHWVVLHRYAGAWRLHSYNAGLGGLVLPRGEDQVAGT